MARFLARFPLERIAGLSADRAFRGHKWLSYLRGRGIAFRLRIPNNTRTHHRKRSARWPVTRGFSVPMGKTRVLNRLWAYGVILCIGSLHVRLAGNMSSSSRPTPQSTHSRTTAGADKQSAVGGIERRGFHLEAAPITDPERVARWIAVMTLALWGCYKVGIGLDRQRPIAIKQHRRRACSVIRLGLDTWRRALLNSASQMRQIRRWIGFFFYQKVAIANT